MQAPADAEEGIPMLVDPALSDDLEGFDLTFWTLAPSPAATRDDDGDEEEDAEDDVDDSEEDSSEDTDESDKEEEDEEDENSRSQIKALRQENKARRLKLREAQRELNALKAKVARLERRNGRGNSRSNAKDDVDDVDEEDDDPTKLTPREEAAEVKSALVDVMQDLGLDKRYRRIITALVDPDEVEIEVSSSGKVTVNGLKEAVEDLLEDYPEWTGKKSGEDDEDEPKFKGSSSGNRRRSGTGNGLDKASLAKKYPALASR